MEVTKHAIDRYRERTGAKFSDDKIRRRLLGMVRTGKPVSLKPHKAVERFLKYEKEARYFKSTGGFIVTVVEDTIVTFHNGESGAWRMRG